MVLVAANCTMNPAPTTGRIARERSRLRESAKAINPNPDTWVATVMTRPRPSTERRAAR
jgi:hypothetical protein